MITLKFFPVNSAWAFLFGRDLMTAKPERIGDFHMFFRTRKDAVMAANSLRLEVAKDGTVECMAAEAAK